MANYKVTIHDENNRVIESRVRYSNKKELKKGGQFSGYLLTIHEIENLCDATYRQALKELWKKEKDFKELIAWKDIISRVESASDACEHVANVLERIRVKYYA